MNTFRTLMRTSAIYLRGPLGPQIEKRWLRTLRTILYESDFLGRLMSLVLDFDDGINLSIMRIFNSILYL